MKLYKMLIALMLSVILLAGCGSSGNFSMGIIKTDDKKHPVEYGMSRSEVEKILGKGKKMSEQIVEYSSLRLWYRDDKISAIIVFINSENEYATTSGVQAGMLEDDIKKIYGEKFFSDKNNGGYLTYYYNTETQDFIYPEQGKETIEAIRMKPEKVYVLKFFFESDSGRLWRYSMGDSKREHYAQ